MARNDSTDSTSATSDEPDDFPAHSRELELLAPTQLVSLLKSSFRNSDFWEVARILSSREQTLKADLAKSEGTIVELGRKIAEERVRFDRLKARYDRSERGRADLEGEVGVLRRREKRLLDEIRAKEEEIGKIRASEETRQLGFIVISDDDEEINANSNVICSGSRGTASTMAVSAQRKRFYDVVSSDSEDDDEMDDKVPLNQLKLKRFEKRVCDSKEPSSSSLNQICAQTLWEREGEKVCKREDLCLSAENEAAFITGD